MTAGGYEADELAMVEHLLGKVDVLVDAGAHYGFYLCVSQKHGVPVIAFEPDTMNVGMIAKNLGANGWGSDVVVIQAGVGYERGFFQFRGGGSGGTLSQGYSSAPRSQVQTIPVVRMDDVVHLQDRKALIIVDVEGFELAALKGAEGILANQNRPIVMVEVFLEELTGDPPKLREDYPKLFKYMEDAGYQAYFFGDTLERIDPAEFARRFAAGDRDLPSGNFLFASKEDASLLQ